MRITKAIIPGWHPFVRFALLCHLLFLLKFSSGQFQDDFTDGDFLYNPSWTGDTADFSMSYSSAIPVGQKPALRLDATESDTSFLVVSSALASHAEWRFWVKMSFNTSANNFARIYLFADQDDLTVPLNGYFVQLGGANDSICLFRQSGNVIDPLIKGAHGYTGNSTNVLRVKVTRDESGHWQLLSDGSGGYNFVAEGACQDNAFNSASFFGIFCKYTSSNSSKFYFDDFYADVLFADTIPPEIISVEVLTDSSLLVHFSEPVEESSAEDSLNYFVNGGTGYAIESFRDPSEPSRVTLLFDSLFEEDFTYTMTVKDISDLSGNVMAMMTVDFAYIPMPPIPPAAIVVHEIMADVSPPPAGLPEADYIELLNCSGSPLNLLGSSLKPRESAAPLFFPELELADGEYLIITNTTSIEAFQDFGQVIGFSGFSVNNEGLIILRNHLGDLVHAISYDQSWYGDSEKEDGGYSLEMIDPSNACSMDRTWGASLSPSGGTPGSINSIYGEVVSEPMVISAILNNSNTLQLLFSHHMDSISITTLSSYSAGEEAQSPVSAVTDEAIFDEVSLVFATPFAPNAMHELVFSDTLRDCCGKPIASGASITFVNPIASEPWDIVINEIMADPDPPVGLPGHEYIELFNTSNRHISTTGWKLSISGDLYSVPGTIIYPDEYVLLVNTEEALIFSVFAKTLVRQGPGLPNNGASLVLYDAQGKMISAGSYMRSWYSNPEQSEGGYSLEQTDPFNPCGGQENWMQSRAEEGGTPGRLNSVDMVNAIVPKIQKAIVRADTLLEIQMNLKMDKSSMIDGSLFYVDNGMGNPAGVRAADSLYDRFFLSFDGEFLPGIVYLLSFGKYVLSCTGAEHDPPEDFAFGWAETPQRSDVVINEVLFNPVGNGVDFVEVYNRSDKVVNLMELMLGTVTTDSFGASDTSYKDVLDEDVLLLPGQLMVLTTDPGRVQEQYYAGPVDRFIRMTSLPAYGNTAGTVILSATDGSLIDYMVYEKEMHHPLLHNLEGVSLERIHPDRSSADRTAWHSASSVSGYATPGLRNSQYAAGKSSSFKMQVEPVVFSPDNDGLDDVTTISYHFETPGYMATIVIFDAGGRAVRTLVYNELLGPEGSFSWDGFTDDRQKANLGIYIVYLEVFDQFGRVEKVKKTVVLAGRLD